MLLLLKGPSEEAFDHSIYLNWPAQPSTITALHQISDVTSIKQCQLDQAAQQLQLKLQDMAKVKICPMRCQVMSDLKAKPQNPGDSRTELHD